MTINDEIRAIYNLFEEKINAGEIEELVEIFLLKMLSSRGTKHPL
jgi:hypothetical protein